MIMYKFLLLAVVYSIHGDDFSPQLFINTSSLGRIQGEIDQRANNVRQFIGIPFAQPPLGALRFKPPVSLPPVNSSSSAIYNATAAAHQGGFPLLNCFQISTGQSNATHGEEDCLYLDIYLPLNINNGTLVPVVIYIYGGGLQTSAPVNPSQLVSLYQNVIYVAIRYRINIFGFMASTALSASRSGPVQASGLQGFEDQQMAIKWVRDNIQAFGGDSNLIILQGHSAGATSVCLHLIAPGSHNLFQRAIIESGGCDIIHSSLAEMETIGDEITSHFCNSSAESISCLQSFDASTLLQYAKSKDYVNFFYANSFHPPIDGLIIPDSITEIFRSKAFSTNISLLTGTTNGEVGLFIGDHFEPGWHVQNLNQSVLSQWVQLYSNGQSAYLNATYNPYVDPNVPAVLVNYYGLNDALSTYRYQCPVRRTAAYLINSGSASVHLYSFEYVPLSSPFAYLSQAVHGQEVPFVFNSPNLFASSIDVVDPDEQVLSRAMSLLWIRFIVNGNPNIPLDNETTNPLIKQLSELGGWPMYFTTNSSTYVIFSNVAKGNSSATVRLATSAYHSPTCAAWDEIVPNPNITKRCNAGYTGPNCTKTNDGISNTDSFLPFQPIIDFFTYLLSKLFLNNLF